VSGEIVGILGRTGGSLLGNLTSSIDCILIMTQFKRMKKDKLGSSPIASPVYGETADVHKMFGRSLTGTPNSSIGYTHTLM
jgi:hypothetical protein